MVKNHAAKNLARFNIEVCIMTACLLSTVIFTCSSAATGFAGWHFHDKSQHEDDEARNKMKVQLRFFRL